MPEKISSLQTPGKRGRLNFKVVRVLRAAACLMLSSVALLVAGDAAGDWSAVIALDAGPGVKPKNAEEAKAAALAHTEKQEKALRAFLGGHADDSNGFEAMLRLSRLLDLRAEMKAEQPPLEAAILLENAGRIATTAERRTELDFSLLSRRMRNWRNKRPSIEERRASLEQARKFESAHAGDRRIAPLFVQIAGLFDFEPKTKEGLLQHAKSLTKDPGLTAQIADDLKRIAFLGKPVPLRFTALDGRRTDTTLWRGNVVAIVFFTTWSEPSRAALAQVGLSAENAGDRVRLVAVSLDAERAPLEKLVRSSGLPCPVAWDGKSWEGPLIQALGINTVPTTWLLDKNGVLRSLDALDDTDGQIRRLLGEN